VILQVIAAVVAIGTVFDPQFNLDGLQALVSGIAIIAAAVGQAYYSHSRATVKAAATTASAQVAAVSKSDGAQVVGSQSRISDGDQGKSHADTVGTSLEPYGSGAPPHDPVLDDIAVELRRIFLKVEALRPPQQ
jgi:hypothetical protein